MVSVHGISVAGGTFPARSGGCSWSRRSAVRARASTSPCRRIAVWYGLRAGPVRDSSSELLRLRACLLHAAREPDASDAADDDSDAADLRPPPPTEPLPPPLPPPSDAAASGTSRCLRLSSGCARRSPRQARRARARRAVRRARLAGRLAARPARRRPPRRATRVYAVVFLALLVAAFALYVGRAGAARRGGASRLRVVAALAVAIQLAPLAAPLLLSTDAWTYWDYGRIATVHDANPYRDAPSTLPRRPGVPVRRRGLARHDVRLRARVHARLGAARRARPATSADAAAWIYKALAAVAVLARGRARRPALAPTGVRARLRRAGTRCWPCTSRAAATTTPGWRRSSSAALALARGRPPAARGRGLGAGRAREVDPARALLPLRALEARPPVARVGLPRLRVAAAVVADAVATWRYGLGWLDAFGPLARNANQETSFAFPHRLEQLGVPRGLALGCFAAALRRRLRAGSSARRCAAARGSALAAGAPAAGHAVPRRLVRRLGRAARGRRGRRPAQLLALGSAPTCCRRRSRSKPSGRGTRRKTSTPSRSKTSRQRGSRRSARRPRSARAGATRGRGSRGASRPRRPTSRRRGAGS